MNCKQTKHIAEDKNSQTEDGDDTLDVYCADDWLLSTVVN
jgi:hypothetical protein